MGPSRPGRLRVRVPVIRANSYLLRDVHGEISVYMQTEIYVEELATHRKLSKNYNCKPGSGGGGAHL